MEWIGKYYTLTYIQPPPPFSLPFPPSPSLLLLPPFSQPPSPSPFSFPFSFPISPSLLPPSPPPPPYKHMIILHYIGLPLHCHMVHRKNWINFWKNSWNISCSKTVTFHRMCGSRPLLQKKMVISTTEWILYGIMHISTMRAPDSTIRFSRLSRVVRLVLVIPHSNATEERVFSMVRKNKTAFRPSLDPKGTLSSILTIKLANTQPAHCYEPSEDVLKKAKSATWEYNKEHSSKN